MRRFNPEVDENDSQEVNEAEEKNGSHFESTYTLRPNEKYETNSYNYETDQHGRIKNCQGTLRLEEGKRNTNHQTKAGGESRLETDEGGHLIGTRFDGSGKVDNIVPMDGYVNRVEYKKLENEWAEELEKGNQVDVKIRCRYEGDSTRPTDFVIKYKVTEPDGSTRSETKIISNEKHGDDK